MIKELALCAFAAAGTLWATSDVNATTVDFSDLANAPFGFVDNAVIPQTFGDTPEVDVTYATLDGGNNWGQSATVFADNVRYWSEAYSGDQAAFADQDNKKVQIKLEAAPGYKITNLIFDFGAYYNLDRTVDYKAFDGLWNQIGGADSFFLTGAIGGGGIVPFVQDLTTVIFQFGDDWNVGLNGFSFDAVSTQNPDPIPIPAGIILAGTALLGLAGTGRLKSRKG